MNLSRLRRLVPAVLVVLFISAARAWAKDAIFYTDASCPGGCALTRNGLIDFANDYKSNPRTLVLNILNHPFNFNVLAGNGANVTSFQFKSSELGINKTFNGANTDDIVTQLKDYIKGSDFLTKFMRLINSGAGGQISGGPTSSMDTMVRATFHDTMFSKLDAVEQKTAARPAGTDPQFSGGFAQFSSDGFQGHSFGVTPGFTLDFGEKRDKKLKISIPLSQIDLGGLKTYRAGLGLQYLYPVHLGDGLTWTISPGISYATTFSMDLPNYSGLIGGAASTSLQKDFDKLFGTAAIYYGRFNNLGGIDTQIQANIYGWGLQAGYRLGRRWVTAVQMVGMHERVVGFPITSYETLANSWSYKIFDRFDVTFSVSKMFGLAKQRYVDVGLGSAWFF